jgi:hypothetical protein
MWSLAAAISILMSLVTATGWAQGTPSLSLAELALYRSSDREQVLVAGAKKEGKVTWYKNSAFNRWYVERVPR